MPGYQSTKRFTGLPLIPAATDIAANQFVKLSSTEWGVLPVKTWTEQPIGYARATAQAGFAVDVIDMQDIKIATLAGSASLAANVFVGVASANIVTTTGANKIMLPQIAKVEAVHGATYTNQAEAVWAIGITIEPVQPGTKFAYFYKIQQLSGAA
jgi:hypothetical protein